MSILTTTVVFESECFETTFCCKGIHNCYQYKTNLNWFYWSIFSYFHWRTKTALQHIFINIVSNLKNQIVFKVLLLNCKCKISKKLALLLNIFRNCPVTISHWKIRQIVNFTLPFKTSTISIIIYRKSIFFQLQHTFCKARLSKPGVWCIISKLINLYSGPEHFHLQVTWSSLQETTLHYFTVTSLLQKEIRVWAVWVNRHFSFFISIWPASPICVFTTLSAARIYYNMLKCFPIWLTDAFQFPMLKYPRLGQCPQATVLNQGGAAWRNL